MELLPPIRAELARAAYITAWALAQFRDHYKDKKIDKWAVFHYVYGLLHHPATARCMPTTSNASCRGLPTTVE